MSLESFIALAKEHGASDLHLEPGLPVALRVRGVVRATGEPVPARELNEGARTLLGANLWQRFVEQGSADLSRTILGTRCRINVLRTARGVGFAIRLLASFQATVEKLNLHPDLKKLVTHPNGLILVSGPTGCGKSSTLAALIQEINLSEPRHIITVESPIEYFFRPRRAFIRQREVGRDTPSFEQALLDALREDPDVLMIGEMRDPETMRLTLNAAETGHLVLATVHSATCVEALQRIVGAFPSEIQSAVAAQLADCLLAAVAQRLHYRADLNMRVPECEILTTTVPVKAHIRNREFYKILSVMEMGADHGMWTWERYRSWMEKQRQWFRPHATTDSADAENEEAEVAALLPARPASRGTTKAPPPHSPGDMDRIVIEPDGASLADLLKELK
ncbi:MAG: type IV pilus twitching motility protein PilT [Syntrophales bacterium]